MIEIVEVNHKVHAFSFQEQGIADSDGWKTAKGLSNLK